ncbi:hypothetical protein MRB53_022668 [Persea americana]|uniref:Uncharacterized protein n=1 Tax=Persea americana TaxID=3435 RepID=A0ACC2L7V3_PERAE|nr:hypothetical protein MRB53_022668 [Persea americana]
MEVEGSSKKMIATQEEMAEAKVPLPYRDQCAHLLIPLNKCRSAELYLPWKCEDERHVYEKCEYELVMERHSQRLIMGCWDLQPRLLEHPIRCSIRGYSVGLCIA